MIAAFGKFIMNRVFSLRIYGQDVIKCSIPWTAALDPKARENSDNGKPVILEPPNLEISMSFTDIAGKMAARLSVISFQGSDKFTIKN